MLLSHYCLGRYDAKYFSKHIASRVRKHLLCGKKKRQKRSLEQTGAKAYDLLLVLFKSLVRDEKETMKQNSIMKSLKKK